MNQWSWAIDQNLINQVQEYQPILIAATEILNDIKENVIEYNTKGNEAATEGGSLFCASVDIEQEDMYAN